MCLHATVCSATKMPTHMALIVASATSVACSIFKCRSISAVSNTPAQLPVQRCVQVQSAQLLEKARNCRHVRWLHMCFTVFVCGSRASERSGPSKAYGRRPSRVPQPRMHNEGDTAQTDSLTLKAKSKSKGGGAERTVLCPR